VQQQKFHAHLKSQRLGKFSTWISAKILQTFGYFDGKESRVKMKMRILFILALVTGLLTTTGN
jgi:cephalosporin-C deacetylase-like acetyl esterase